MNSFFRRHACFLMLLSSGVFLADNMLHYFGRSYEGLLELEQKKAKNEKEEKDEQKEEKENEEKDEKERHKFQQLSLLLSKLARNSHSDGNVLHSQLPSELETPPPEFS